MKTRSPCPAALYRACRWRRTSRQAVVASALFALLSACGGGGGGAASAPTPVVTTPPRTPTVDCSEAGQKQFVLDVARDWYRWVDELAPVVPEDYATASEFLVALTAPLAEDFRDPGFSYLTTAAEDEVNFTTGAFAGFGFRFAIDVEGRYRISDVFESGTAYGRGFRRGAELIAVDRGAGFRTFAEFEAQGVDFDEIFGPPVVGVERGFQLRIDGEIREIFLSKTELAVPPVARTTRLLERPGLPPVGYLYLREFTTSAIPPLDEAFDAFRRAGVTDFVVDLRYNGGGSLEVAEHFLDLFGGDIAASREAYRLRHNDLRANEDYAARFLRRAQSVVPNRIAFITTEATASSSEVTINSLSPYVETVLVGSDTFGKAVGQYGFDQRGCDTRLRLVAFDTVNAEGLGEYFTGLVDTGRFTLCPAQDSLRGAFGDPGEDMLSAALGWLNDGTCPVLAASSSGEGSSLRRRPRVALPATRPDRRSPWVR